MIKRLGDFTVRELLEFCKKQERCFNCPFSAYCHKHGVMTRINEADLILKVEVEDEDEQK